MTRSVEQLNKADVWNQSFVVISPNFTVRLFRLESFIEEKMISQLLSRLIILAFGTLYPGYASYKAVRTKNVREYVKWMMYWVVFAFFTAAETIGDTFLSWLPLYFELKIIFVIWLLAPATKGSSYLYRKFVHPYLMAHEHEIDQYLERASSNGMTVLRSAGHRGLQAVATGVMQSNVMNMSQTYLQQQIQQVLKPNVVQGSTASDGQVMGIPAPASPSSSSSVPVVTPVSTAENVTISHMKEQETISLPQAVDQQPLPVSAYSDSPSIKAEARLSDSSETETTVVRTAATAQQQSRTLPSSGSTSRYARRQPRTTADKTSTAPSARSRKLPNLRKSKDG